MCWNMNPSKCSAMHLMCIEHNNLMASIVYGLWTELAFKLCKYEDDSMTQNHDFFISILKSVRMVYLMFAGCFYWRRVFHLSTLKSTNRRLPLLLHRWMFSWHRFFIHSKIVRIFAFFAFNTNDGKWWMVGATRATLNQFFLRKKFPAQWFHSFIIFSNRKQTIWDSNHLWISYCALNALPLTKTKSSQRTTRESERVCNLCVIYYCFGIEIKKYTRIEFFSILQTFYLCVQLYIQLFKPQLCIAMNSR